MTWRFLFPAFVGSLAFFSLPAWPDEVIPPGNGFGVSHYEALWTKSPFAVASTEAAPESSDYSLYGVAQADGISYVSLIDKQSQEHFLVASNKPVKGVTLVSVTPGHDASSTQVVIQKGGQSITLKLEQAPAVLAQVPNMINMPNTRPNFMQNQIQVPGGVNPGANNPGQVPPRPIFHPRTIHVPPPPVPQPQGQAPQ
jgi:hypothetical protein